jgi:hypothetical protein
MGNYLSFCLIQWKLHHGEPVEVPNYAGENIVEMQLLIGNNKKKKPSNYF